MTWLIYHIHGHHMYPSKLDRKKLLYVSKNNGILNKMIIIQICDKAKVAS